MTQIDTYPWAVPTQEQKKMFDAMSDEEQLNMLRQAIIDGENSGISDACNMEEIIQKAKQKAGLLSGEKNIKNQSKK